MKTNKQTNKQTNKTKMEKEFNIEIYQSFARSKGADWFTPSNSVKYMTCGEYTLARDLVEMGIMEMKKEDGQWSFRNIKKEKTQISNLRSGTPKQILNSNVDYSLLPSATNYRGHAGTNFAEVDKIWEKVKAENPQEMHCTVSGIEVTLTANWSLSGKTVMYTGTMTKDDLKSLGLDPAKRKSPIVMILGGNNVAISNGQRGRIAVCPSLVKII